MAEHDEDPAVTLADRGYDSDAIRDDVRARGGQPEIPTKRTGAFSIRLLAHTVKLSSLNADDFDGVFYPGGHSRYGICRRI